MKKIFRTAQFLSYLATIVIAITLPMLVPRSEAPSPKAALEETRESPVQPNRAASPVGKPVSLEGVNWKENRRTLILYLSTQCRYCHESSPFYQRLVAMNTKNKDLKLVAVLSQPVDDAVKYLKSNSIGIEQVYNGSLVNIGVRSTPTLLLVNEEGVVSDFWRGKLTPEKEEEVMKKISS